jgi:hypothetical protein
MGGALLTMPPRDSLISDLAFSALITVMLKMRLMARPRRQHQMPRRYYAATAGLLRAALLFFLK